MGRKRNRILPFVVRLIRVAGARKGRTMLFMVRYKQGKGDHPQNALIQAGSAWQAACIYFKMQDTDYGDSQGLALFPRCYVHALDVPRRSGVIMEPPIEGKCYTRSQYHRARFQQMKKTSSQVL